MVPIILPRASFNFLQQLLYWLKFWTFVVWHVSLIESYGILRCWNWRQLHTRNSYTLCAKTSTKRHTYYNWLHLPVSLYVYLKYFKNVLNLDWLKSVCKLSNRAWCNDDMFLVSCQFIYTSIKFLKWIYYDHRNRCLWCYKEVNLTSCFKIYYPISYYPIIRLKLISHCLNWKIHCDKKIGSLN